MLAWMLESTMAKLLDSQLVVSALQSESQLEQLLALQSASQSDSQLVLSVLRLGWMLGRMLEQQLGRI